jgi:hypothetical protein
MGLASRCQRGGVTRGGGDRRVVCRDQLRFAGTGLSKCSSVRRDSGRPRPRSGVVTAGDGEQATCEYRPAGH